MRTFEFYSTNYSTIIQADTLHLAIKEFMRRYPNDEILQIEDVASRESKSAVPSEIEYSTYTRDEVIKLLNCIMMHYAIRDKTKGNFSVKDFIDEYLQINRKP